MDKKKLSKILNVVIWLFIIGMISWSVFTFISDPQGAWNRFLIRIQDPWSYVPFGFLVLIPIVVGIALLYDKFVKQPRVDRLVEQWKKSMIKSAEESDLMRENDVPDDESIAKYYKMYLKKWELDNEDTWTTCTPMSFKDWEKDAKSEPKEFGRVRWQFMIAMTSDTFMGFPGSNTHVMMRHRDYESMID